MCTTDFERDGRGSVSQDSIEPQFISFIGADNPMQSAPFLLASALGSFLPQGITNFFPWPVFLVMGLVLIGAGAWLIIYGIRKYLVWQAVKNLPTSKVRSAAIGLVELSGSARYDKPLISPISKKGCAYWKVSVGRVGDKGNNLEFYKDESAAPFYVEDDTGRMLIDPKGAEVNIGYEAHFRYSCRGYMTSHKSNRLKIEFRVGAYPRYASLYEFKRMIGLAFCKDDIEAMTDAIERKGAKRFVVRGANGVEYAIEKNDDGTLSLKTTDNNLLDQKVVDYIASNDKLRGRGELNADLIVVESAISDSDPLYVLGRADAKPGSASEARYEDLVVHRGPEKIFQISDGSERNFATYMLVLAIGSLLLGLWLFAWGLAMLIFVIMAFGLI